MNLPISKKQRKQQSHAQCHVKHRIEIFRQISEHVPIPISTDFHVTGVTAPEGGAVTHH